MSWKREGLFDTEKEEEEAKEKMFFILKVAAIVYAVALAVMLLKN